MNITRVSTTYLERTVHGYATVNATLNDFIFDLIIKSRNQLITRIFWSLLQWQPT